MQILLVFVLFISCNPNPEIKNFFNYVKSKSTATDINDYTKISEDSIFYAYSEMIPTFIHKNYKSYPNRTELTKELKSNFGIKAEYIEREVLMMLFHLELTGKKLSKNNLETHWTYYQQTNEDQDQKDSIKLNKFIAQNFKNHNVGSLVEVKFEVEKSKYDESRTMTYPSVYHMIKPKEKLEDSLVIKGKILRKGNYPDFSNEIEMVNQMNPLMFEIEMTEINDTSISIAYRGPTDKLRIGELFYIDLEGYGCREINKVNE
jgi:hypothetical protein